MGTTAMGRTEAGRSSSWRSSSAKRVANVVMADPRPRAVADRRRFWVAGNTEEGRVTSSPMAASPHTTMMTGAEPIPTFGPLVDLAEQ